MANFLLSAVCVAQSEKVYNVDELATVNGLVFIRKDSTLVTSIVTAYYWSGAKRFQYNYKNDKKDGLIKVGKKMVSCKENPILS